MHKLLIAFSLLFSSANVSYAEIEYVECYNNINKKIEIVFGFNCDYLESHPMHVSLDIYDSNNQIIATYNNVIKVIGRREAKASIDYLYRDGLKVDVTITYNEEKLVDHIRLELIRNEVCYLDAANKNCSMPYKSRYENDVIINYKSDFKILYLPFDSFLSDNYLNIEDIIVYSNCDVKDAEVYLYIKDEIEGYNMLYDNGYRFLLGVEKENNKYSFYLLEKHYLTLPKFNFSDEYSEEAIVTNNIYFPYLKEQKEYECLLVIKGKIDVEITFFVFTSDMLYGDCSDSKYCMGISIYD